ncbi:50S ribosomal protein L5 [Candidatus Micrarchaeota archaeon RBG_16_36_9]|nr:50S ribosomal protein L5 [uncultured archaeon]OGI11941.1 MAG: 50S ribosomal protein L5 [Candidatus Micrarchaeota archaeon RBG_16_36_9]
MNAMRNIKIEKITINIGCGSAGDKLEKAKSLLEKLTEKKIVTTITKTRNTFGSAKGRPIGCKVTLRRSDAENFLKKAFEAVDKKLSKNIFDEQGNFSFGIKEHIDIPGVRYDPEIGILGMDVCVTLERPGFRVKRKRFGGKIGKGHLIKPEESMEWVSKNYGVEVS